MECGFIILDLILASRKRFYLREIKLYKNVVIAFGSSCLKIIFVLLTKVITFYIRGFIVQFQIFGLESPIQHVFSRVSEFL